MSATRRLEVHIEASRLVKSHEICRLYRHIHFSLALDLSLGAYNVILGGHCQISRHFWANWIGGKYGPLLEGIQDPRSMLVARLHKESVY